MQQTDTLRLPLIWKGLRKRLIGLTNFTIREKFTVFFVLKHTYFGCKSFRSLLDSEDPERYVFRIYRGNTNLEKKNQFKTLKTRKINKLVNFL